MKKISEFLFCLLLCLCTLLWVSAEGESGGEQTIDASQPRLMVTSYEVENNCVTPRQTSKIKIVIKNQSNTKAVRNIKLSLTEDSGDLKTEGMGTQYVNAIYAGSSYTWELNLTAAGTAQIGEHTVTVAMEYEDKDYNAYSASDLLRIDVKQSVALDYDGASLPVKMTQGDTVSVSVNLMNTGKTDLSNVKLEVAVDGLDAGGVVFIGEIHAGENAAASANLRVGSDLLGETSGVITISYEDAYGEAYTKTVDVSTTIVEKTTVPSVEEEDESPDYPLWWAFLLTGLAVGGAVGAIIPISVHSRKKRREDEMRL